MRVYGHVEVGQHPLHQRTGPAAGGHRRDGQLAASWHGAHRATAVTVTQGASSPSASRSPRPLFLSPAKGAPTSVYLASSPEVATGQRRSTSSSASPRPRSRRPGTPRRPAGCGRSAKSWCGLRHRRESEHACTGHRRRPGHRAGHGRSADRPGPRGGGHGPGPELLSDLAVAQVLALDVGDTTSVAGCLAAAGELDAMVNNAGLTGGGPAGGLTRWTSSPGARGQPVGPLRMAQAVVPGLAGTGQRRAGQHQLGAGQDRHATGRGLRGQQACPRGAVGDPPLRARPLRDPGGASSNRATSHRA